MGGRADARLLGRTTLRPALAEIGERPEPEPEPEPEPDSLKDATIVDTQL